jgi:phosphoribosylformylglycinamidine synthase
VGLDVVTEDSVFTGSYGEGERVEFPIAHHDGNYFADPETLARLAGEDRIALRYAENPNGSAGDIAGILSENRRVLGLMPHPERAVDPAHGGVDGARMFAGLAAIPAGGALQGA